MTKQQTPSGCKKENAVEGPREVSAEESEPKDKGTSDHEKGLDSQPTVKPSCDIDDGGPLSI
jgi:hypothetical protein